MKGNDDGIREIAITGADGVQAVGREPQRFPSRAGDWRRGVALAAALAERSKDRNPENESAVASPLIAPCQSEPELIHAPSTQLPD